jgi:hypothetical protein
MMAQVTAYQALQTLTASRGESALENVYVVRGTSGTPQPEEWVVYRGRPLDRTFRTTSIQEDGRIGFGKISTKDVGLQPHAQKINFTVINVDSNAAWHIAKRQARKEDFKFQRIDYELKTNPMAGVPAWSMRLFNDKKHYLGELTISAATGEILHPLKLEKFQMQDIDGQMQLVTVSEPWPRRAVRSIGRWFSQTGTIYGRDLLRAAGTAEDIVVGRRSRDFAEDAN